MDEIKGITQHTIERFKERWKTLNGKEIKESNVLSALRDIILKSRPEPKETLVLLQRKEKHGGNVRYYMISGPWRLIWQDGSLVTIELRKMNKEIGPAEQHKVNLIKKEEKTRIKKWRRDNNIPRTRGAHY